MGQYKNGLRMAWIVSVSDLFCLGCSFNLEKKGPVCRKLLQTSMESGNGICHINISTVFATSKHWHKSLICCITVLWWKCMSSILRHHAINRKIRWSKYSPSFCVVWIEISSNKPDGSTMFWEWSELSVSDLFLTCFCGRELYRETNGEYGHKTLKSWFLAARNK